MLKRIPKRITSEFLDKHYACMDSTEHFAENYPDGVDITEANLVAWMRDRIFGGDVFWLMETLLGGQEEEIYNRVSANHAQTTDGYTTPEFDRSYVRSCMRVIRNKWKKQGKH